MLFNDVAAISREIKERVNLVDFIGKDLELKQQGTRWRGFCPFHADTNPSFAVLPPRDGKISKWGCHPCNIGGDIFDYVQRRYTCSLTEAIEIVIERTGFDASLYVREATAEEKAKDEQYAYLHAMAKYFHEILLASPKELFYLTEERGLSEGTIERFMLGFCPSTQFAFQAFGEAVLRYIEPNPQNWDSLFGGHILIPQFTSRGKVWGWYSRHAEGKPKYGSMSSQSPCYDAAGRLYGLAQTRKLPERDQSKIVIVEGFFDVMMLQQHGIAAIASCSTNLTDQQVETLQGHGIRDIVVAFDGDSAGRKAMRDLALRSHQIHGMNLKFAVVPGDPDEFIDQQGRNAFEIRLNDAVCGVEFVVNEYTDTDLTTVTQKHDAFQHTIEFLSSIPRDSYLRQLGVETLCERLDITTDVVLDALETRTAPAHSSMVAERVALAEFLQNPKAFSLYPLLKSKSFSYHSHQMLFALYEEMHANGISINYTTIVHEISVRRIGDVYLNLLNDVFQKDVSEASHFINEVIQLAGRRDIAKLSKRFDNDLVDTKTDLSKSICNFTENVTRLLVGATVKQVVFTPQEAAHNAIVEFEARQASEVPASGLNPGPGFATFFTHTKGFRGRNVYLVLAPSGVGKSLKLINWAYGLSMRAAGPRAHGLFVGMEMTATENLDRLIAIDSGLPYDHIACGRFDDEAALNHVRDSFIRVKNVPIHWMEGPQSVAQIATQARILKSQGQLDYIMIDYIQLLNVQVYESAWSKVEKYEQASSDIHALANELDVPIIAAGQLNRAAYQESIPTGDMIGNCLKFYQDAHVVLILVDRMDGMIGHLDKNRHGAKNQTTMYSKHTEPGRANLRIQEMRN